MCRLRRATQRLYAVSCLNLVILWSGGRGGMNSSGMERNITFAPPITFKTKLRNLQVEEENSLTLSCELSKPGLAVEWRKGEELLKNNFKYQIKNRNSVMELTVKNAQLEDSGGVCTLVIKNLTTSDGGIYTCEVVNKFGVTSYNGNVTVVQPQQAAPTAQKPVRVTMTSTTTTASNNSTTCTTAIMQLLLLLVLL
uniref:Ig-like domain-containing protein n=1 Tax=Seriola lalandi dorsalis TaxID=1841481 RepID=A0A3B4Y1I0_SERLL